MYKLDLCSICAISKTPLMIVVRGAGEGQGRERGREGKAEEYGRCMEREWSRER